jgi:hypothetical protein
MTFPDLVAYLRDHEDVHKNNQRTIQSDRKSQTYKLSKKRPVNVSYRQKNKVKMGKKRRFRNDKGEANKSNKNTVKRFSLPSPPK